MLDHLKRLFTVSNNNQAPSYRIGGERVIFSSTNVPFVYGEVHYSGYEHDGLPRGLYRLVRRDYVPYSDGEPSWNYIGVLILPVNLGGYSDEGNLGWLYEQLLNHAIKGEYISLYKRLQHMPDWFLDRSDTAKFCMENDKCKTAHRFIQ